MSMSLLVVDDSPAIHKVIRIALSRHNFEVIPASSVAEANAELRRRQFSLVLIDSGISAELRTFEAIKAASRQVPILILMSGLDKLREEDLRSIGINIFLKKPFEAKEILATVQRVLGIEPELPILKQSAEPTKFVPPHLPPAPISSNHQNLPPLPNTRSSEIGTKAEAAPSARIEKAASPPSVGEWTIAHIAPEIRRGDGEDSGSYDRIPAVFSDFEMMSPNEDPAVISARLPLHDNSKKGKKAFGEPEPAPLPPTGRPAVPRDNAPTQEHRFGRNPVAEPTVDKSSMVMPINIGMTVAEITQVIKNAVNDYCESHFEALTREIITSELRRLAEEKSRHLLDG